MRIVQFKEKVSPLGFVFERGIKYIITDRLTENVNPELIEFNEDLVSTYPDRIYKGQELNGKSLITIRNGGIGDLLFETPSLKKLKELYSDCHLTLACNKKYSALLNGLLWLNIMNLPLTLEDLLIRDYFLIFEGLIEDNPAAEIKNAYQLHLEHFGLKDKMTGKELPEVYVDSLIDKQVKYQLKPYKLDGLKIVTIIWAASVPIRSVNPIFWYRLWKYLKDLDIMMVISGSPSQLPEIKQFVDKFKEETSAKNIKVWTEVKSLQQSVALVNNSDVVIGPDSGLLHVAGALKIPIIGLFGAFPTQLRLATYNNAIGLDVINEANKEKCPQARGIYNCCFQHDGLSCVQAEKIKEFYSPCMMKIKLEDVIKSLHLLHIIGN